MMTFMMLNGLLIFMVAVSVLVVVTGTSEQQVDTENHDLYVNRMDIQARYGACNRGLGGKCVKRGKNCPKRFPLETKRGRPYCNKRRRCCYPDLTIPQLTEQLFACDVNRVYGKLIITENKNPLLSGPSVIFSGDTYRTLLDLQLKGGYIPDVNEKEDIDGSRWNYQNKFLDAIMNTQVMKITEDYLKKEDKLKPFTNLKKKLDEIWFTLYSRAKDKKIEGSSGFEHVFLGETRGDTVLGFHNWVFLFHGQYNPSPPSITYIPPLPKENVLALGNNGKIVQINFIWDKKMKNGGSMFIGSSPELDMAVYTICFLMKPKDSKEKCRVKMSEKYFDIQTYDIQSNDKQLVASAFPMVPK